MMALWVSGLVRRLHHPLDVFVVMIRVTDTTARAAVWRQIDTERTEQACMSTNKMPVIAPAVKNHNHREWTPTPE
jgi:hypothetical protein